jgi:hypothetical protein
MGLQTPPLELPEEKHFFSIKIVYSSHTEI